jgi:hypothetical protein
MKCPPMPSVIVIGLKSMRDRVRLAREYERMQSSPHLSPTIGQEAATSSIDFQLLNIACEKIGTGRVLKDRFFLHREL